MVNRFKFFDIKHLIVVLLYCLLFGLSIESFSQKPILEFDNFTAIEKITNSKSSDIVQDSDGYIWIATEEGLLKYDGQNIVSYKFNENDKFSLPSNIVNKLYIDQNNKLWILTNEGVCIYNPEYDYFNQLITTSNLNGVNSVFISAINEDKNGKLYLANENVIFTCYENNTFIKVTEIQQGRINSLVFDSENNIWIGAYLNAGLFYFNQKTNQIIKFEDFVNDNSFISKEIQSISIINERLWVCTLGDGIMSYDFQEKKIRKYKFPLKLENFAVNILADSKKRIWICTYNGLKLYNPTEDNFYIWEYQHNNPKSVSGSLWNIFEDNNGNFWTTSTEGGIKIAKNNNKFNRIDSNPLNFWHLSKKNITSISTDIYGNLWAGFYLSGINIFKWDEKKTERYENIEKNLKSVGNGTTFSIYRDSKNQMWLGSYLGGLQKFNFETKDFESFVHNPKDNFSIADNDVRSICEDKKGNLWLAIQGKGVDYFDVKKKIFYHYDSKNNKLSSDYTFQVYLDTKNNLWVASAWGLNLLPEGEKTFKPFNFDVNNPATLSSNFVHTIYEDEKNNLWIGTADGLNLYDYNTNTFKRFSAGLRNKQVGSILSDARGNIWVSTNIGISKLNVETEVFTNYDREDGLLSKDYSLRSCYKDKNNTLYFGGSEGIDYFNPDSLSINRIPPKIVFSDFRTSQKSLNWRTDSSMINKHISFAKQITLNYTNNYFTIQFLAVNPANKEAITYLYILEGFDKNWINSNTKGEATYTNLSPGKYKFRVKAMIDNQVWDTNETSLDIIITPAWWMTSLFKVLISLFILLLPVFYILRRINNYKKQKIKLEETVAERTKEILNMNDQLKSQALSLSSKNKQLNNLNETKDKLLSIISHDLRSPFNAILGYQDLIISNYLNLSKEEQLNMLIDINSTTKHTYYLIENLLNWARIQTYSIKYEPSEFEIRPFMLEKTELYSKIANTKKINFTQYYPENIFAIADLNILETVIRNLITNSIKFTPVGGQITLSAKAVSDNVIITVKDSGIGMNSEQLKTLFEDGHLHTNYGTQGEKGTGIGLKICREFVEKNKGKIWVTSDLGSGSQFNFSIPLSNKVLS